MKYKKSEESLLGARTFIVLFIVIVIAIILLTLTKNLGEIGQNIWKGIKEVLPFV